MSLLRRTNGRHRSLAAERSAARTAVLVPTIRDDRVVTRPDQYPTPVEAKLLRLTTRRALAPNSERPDRWTPPHKAGLPCQHHVADDPSTYDKSNISSSPRSQHRKRNGSKILKTP
jgi:hypothetical protein